MKLAYISVNRQAVARNSRTGSREPPVSIRVGKYGKPRYVDRLKINGPCEIIYDADKPILKCGARLVIVTEVARVLG